MELIQEVKIKQEQKLILTPVMLQAIKLLRCSGLELEDYVKEQLLENPMLERREEDYLKPHREEDYCCGWPEAGLDNFRNEEEEQETLGDHLRFQLAGCRGRDGTRLTEGENLLADYIIESLDEKGYLTSSVSEIAALTGNSLESVKRVARLIRTFDPPGICAVGLSDCLSLQLRAAGKAGGLADTLVRSHLKELASGSVAGLQQKLGVTVEDITDALALIRSLDPKPGARYSTRSEDNSYIIPDACIEEEKTDDPALRRYIVYMRCDRTAGVTVSDSYRELAAEAAGDPKVLEYLREKVREAEWLIRNITGRQETMYKIFCLIADRQQEFMSRGVRYLKPLTQKTIAQVLGVHVSTVSRAVNGKYIQTPQGVYPAGFFFSGGLGTEEEISSKAVKVLLKELIAGEDKAKPYSDSRLADLLAQQGIEIARRTVAKYREQLGIPVAKCRKR